MQNQVSISIYIAKAICYTMICSQIEYSVLLITWQEINVKMQVHISQSIKIIIKQEFVKIMKNQCFNWKSIFMNFQLVCRWNFKSIIISVKSLYNSHLYYQSSEYISYSQSYSVSVYQQDEWLSQEYNSYWENKYSNKILHFRIQYHEMINQLCQFQSNF